MSVPAGHVYKIEAMHPIPRARRTKRQVARFDPSDMLLGLAIGFSVASVVLSWYVIFTAMLILARS